MFEADNSRRQALTEGYRRLGVPADYHLPRRLETSSSFF